MFHLAEKRRVSTNGYRIPDSRLREIELETPEMKKEKELRETIDIGRPNIPIQCFPNFYSLCSGNDVNLESGVPCVNFQELFYEENNGT